MKRIAVVAEGLDRREIVSALEREPGWAVTAFDLQTTEVDPALDALVVHAFAPRVAELVEAHPRVVLCCAPSADAAAPRLGNTEEDCIDRVAMLLADAYIWRHHLAAAAVGYVLDEPIEARRGGPARLVFLGHGGADHTRSSVAPQIGASFEISTGGETLLVGRRSQRAAAIRFATAVARQHTEFKMKDGNVLVRDLGSTNGTQVGAAFLPLAKFEVLPFGAEVRIAGFLRLRLDGRAGG